MGREVEREGEEMERGESVYGIKYNLGKCTDMYVEERQRKR